MNNNYENERILNIMLLGDASVGKTSFIIKYTDNCFQEVYLSTIGIDFKEKEVMIEGEKYKLLLYDTTGQEKFKSLAFNIIKNSNGIILMYDITDIESFNSITEWIKSVKERKGDNFPLLLIGNKIDLEDKRLISKEEGEDLAFKYNIPFFEVSNKNGINIDEACLTLVKAILNNNEDIELKLDTSALSKDIAKKKKCC